MKCSLKCDEISTIYSRHNACFCALCKHIKPQLDFGKHLGNNCPMSDFQANNWNLSCQVLEVATYFIANQIGSYGKRQKLEKCDKLV